MPKIDPNSKKGQTGQKKFLLIKNIFNQKTEFTIPNYVLQSKKNAYGVPFPS
jgi:hypothetical protein